MAARKNVYNLLNLAGIAFIAVAVIGFIGAALDIAPLATTLLMTGLSVVTTFILVYEDELKIESKLGATVVILDLLFILSAAVGLVTIVTTALGLPAPKDEVANTVQMARSIVLGLIGVGLFALGEVLEEV